MMANCVYRVPPGWELRRVDEIKSSEPHSCVAGPFGSEISSKYFTEEGIPVIRGTNLRDDLTRFVPDGFAFVSETRAQEYKPQHVRSGDLVFTCWGTVGQVGIIPEDGPFPEYIISNKQLKLRVDRTIAHPLFCFYYFGSPAYAAYVRNRGIGGAVPGINLGILKSLTIGLPGIEIQNQIVAVLSAYDELIENNRRRMALLEESARLLYQEWFVRFRFPGHEHSRVTDGVPEGWKKSFLSEYVDRDLVRIQTGPFGTQLRASDYAETGTPVINVRNIGYGNLRPDKLEFVSNEMTERLSVHVLKAGDIVFGRKGAVDRHLLVSPDLEGWMQGSDCISLRSFSDELSTTLLSFAFRQESHKQWMLTQCGNKATMASLNQEVIGRISVILPASNLLREFQDFADDVLRQIGLLERQNQKLRDARNLLLPRLMSGEISI